MKLVQLIREWCRDYVVFTKSIVFILGLIFSYKLVEKTFLNILITRLTSAWGDYNFRRAVVVVNLQEGSAALLVAFFAYVAEVHTGRFKMAVFSTAVCIIGLLLNALQVGNNEQRLDVHLFYPALALMTLAQAAQTFTLRAFLDDQLRPRNVTVAPAAAHLTDERRSMFWWYFVAFIAAIFAQFGPLADYGFRKLALVLVAMMGSSFLLFLLGTKYYLFVSTVPNPLRGVGSVLVKAVAKRKVEYPQAPEGLFHNFNGDLHIPPRVPWLRWVDRAAVVQGGEAVPSTVEQVRRVKLLLKMLPLWSCFLTLSLVAASGSTFFLEEAYSLNGGNIRNIIFFANLQRFTQAVVLVISDYTITRLKRYSEQKMELVRIGIGMFCCTLCCAVAWATAAERRQHRTGMSVYWLTPRYLLLGITGGLAGDGLQLFYKSQVLESLFRFGPPFVEIMMGVGRYLSIVCVFVFSGKWFQKDLEDSRLDKYYIFLGCLSVGNFVAYCLAARWYGDDDFLVDEETGIVEQMLAEIERRQRALSEPEERRMRGEDNRGESSASVSGFGQEAEVYEDPLLGSSESNKNLSAYNYVLMRAVTVFSRLNSRAARRRQLKDQ
ncbi:protein NRT1/ PTR FAMILY 5.6-like [Salvia hispanica]|uniref:protein NRT1/ PTR FAMILY 5.6-like n=1 Tax=Salvia hispanica TaxID=49212 RepID=UPI0020093720|nr:protein NRT1/ PTR FAMILY 5.6-like [Salvia hispanica]